MAALAALFGCVVGSTCVRRRKRIRGSLPRLANGAAVRIYARSPDGRWLVTQVVDGDYGRIALAWVMARYVAVEGAVEDLPVKEP